MKIRFVHKRTMNVPTGRIVTSVVKDNAKEVPVEKHEKPKNKRTKKSSEMITNEQIAAAEEVMDMIAPEVKVVKKDRGLIERTESSKIILTEDNRQVLND